MGAITGAPSAMKVGGKVGANGPKRGIYHVKVADANIKYSKQPGERPGFELTFNGFKDSEHPDKEGKKLLTQTFWGECDIDDNDKKETMRRMLRDRLFKPFGVEWPKEGKSVEARIFQGKDIYVLIDANKDGDRNEIAAMAKKPEDLPKLKAAKSEEAEGAAEGEEKPTPAKRR
mgnify:CR=1 FL=1